MELNDRTKSEHDSQVREVTHVNGTGTYQDSALKRFIRFPASLGFVSNLQLSWVSIAVSFQAGLFNGGPTALVYGTILCWFGSVALAASLGEMASMFVVTHYMKETFD